MRFLVRPRWAVVGAAGVCGALLGPDLLAQGPSIRLENNEREKVLEIVLGPFELPSGTRDSAEIDSECRPNFAIDNPEWMASAEKQKLALLDPVEFSQPISPGRVNTAKPR